MQLGYTTKPAIAVEGMIADSRIMRNIVSRFASGVIKAGRGVFRASAFEPSQADGDRAMPGQVVQALSPAAAADDDAFASGTVIKSIIAGGTYLAAAFDGVIGAGTVRPARRITVIFDASTDWDPGTGSITYVNEYGDEVTESLAVATSASLTTTGKARSVKSITLPAATGVGGTAKIGIAALTFAAADFEGVAVYDASIEREADAIAAEVEYGDKVCLPVLDKGAVYVLPEQAVTPADPVYVRIASGAGGSSLGRFRMDADTATAVVLTGAKWGSKAAANTPAVLILP